MNIVISPEAARDIDEACQWIARYNAKAALFLFESLVSAISGLPGFPGNYPLSPESKLGFTDEEVHQMLHAHGRTKYRVLFTMSGLEIKIVRVMHGARLYVGQDDAG